MSLSRVRTRRIVIVGLCLFVFILSTSLAMLSPVHATGINTVNLDAASMSSTDVIVNASATQVSSFRVSAVVKANATAPISNIAGWQFGISYDPNVLVPIGDPIAGSESATRDVVFGSQTNCGFTGSWSSMIAGQQGFGTGSLSVDKSNPSRNDVVVGFTVVSPTPPVAIKANCQLASVSFELVSQPSTPEILNINQVIFATPTGQAISNVVAGSGATETIANNPPTAVFSATHLPQGDPSCVPVTGTSCGASAYQFNGTNSTDSDGTVTTWAWDFGDGSIDTTTGAIVVHDYSTGGNIPVTLRVVDNQGATGAAKDGNGGVLNNNQPSHAFLVVQGANQPPVAVFTFSPSTPEAQQSVLFDGSASYDTDGTVVSYSWNFGDGSPAASGAQVSHVFAVYGNYDVTLTVVDDLGASSNSTATITVSPLPPNSKFTASATTTLTGTGVTFDASKSTDPNLGATITSYAWSFGDGTSGSGVKVTHAFATAGIYTVTLTETDSLGATSSVSANEAVDDRAPTATVSMSAPTAPTGTIITFDGSGSFDVDGSIVAYSWSFGDGSTSTAATVNHSFAIAGTYTVTLTVTDNSGNKATATATVTITDQPPVASFTSSTNSALTGIAINFDGSGSSDIDGTVVSYAWSFGDGATASGVAASHSYAAAGSYTVILTVTDDSGSIASASSIETIIDRVPTASFTFTPTNPVAGASVSFDGTASQDPDGTIMAYAWSFGDGTTGAGATPTHVYTTPGTFTIVLTVTDNSMNTGTATAQITVAQPTGAHAALINWQAQAKPSKVSIKSTSGTTFYAWGNNTGTFTVYVYVRFHVTLETGASQDVYTQVVQLAPGQSINGKQDSRFTAVYHPTTTGVNSVTATIYYSVVNAPIGNSVYAADLASRITLTLRVTP